MGHKHYKDKLKLITLRTMREKRKFKDNEIKLNWREIFIDKKCKHLKDMLK